MMDLYVNSQVGIEQALERAKELELSKIGFLSYLSEVKDVSGWVKKTEREGLVPGVVIRTDKPDVMNRLVDKVRKKVPLLVVEGKPYSVHRAACSNPKVDVLCSPERNRKDCGFDHVCARMAADNSVALGLCFRDLIDSYGKKRSSILGKMRTNVSLSQKFNTPLVIVSGAQDVWEMRAGKELASLGNLLGLELDQSLAAVDSTPQTILNNLKKSTSVEGVENV